MQHEKWALNGLRFRAKHRNAQTATLRRNARPENIQRKGINTQVYNELQTITQMGTHCESKLTLVYN